METNKIDSFFKKSVNESENYFESQANEAKSRIWSQVQKKNKKPFIPLFYSLLVAACILLFLSTSILIFSNLQSRQEINALVKLNSELESKAAGKSKSNLANNLPASGDELKAKDTVYIEKEVFITKPIVQKERIIDTVYVPQIVYVEKEFTPEELITIEKSSRSDTVVQIVPEAYKTEILISKNEALQKEKKKKFQIKFGGSQNPGNDGTIALSSKL